MFLLPQQTIAYDIVRTLLFAVVVGAIVTSCMHFLHATFFEQEQKKVPTHKQVTGNPDDQLWLEKLCGWIWHISTTNHGYSLI